MQLAFFPALEHFVTFEETNVELYEFLKENKWQYYLILVMGWLIGGLYEEIVFHGFMFSRLEKMFHGKYSTHISFVITSILFGVYHFQLGTGGLINALIVGAVYNALFLYFKRNLWYSIFCHGTYNTLVIVLIYNGYL
jgi:membrane protease YdiL (CAAX protease family)